MGVGGQNYLKIFINHYHLYVQFLQNVILSLSYFNTNISLKNNNKLHEISK